MARRKQTTSKQKPRGKRAGERQLAKAIAKPDPYPLVNDWLEAVIIFVAGLGVFGGMFALWYLIEQVQ